MALPVTRLQSGDEKSSDWANSGTIQVQAITYVDVQRKSVGKIECEYVVRVKKAIEDGFKGEYRHLTRKSTWHYSCRRMTESMRTLSWLGRRDLANKAPVLCPGDLRAGQGDRFGGIGVRNLNCHSEGRLL